MVPKRLDVHEADAGGHPVVLGADALRALERRLAQLAPSACFVLGDETTLRHCHAELLAAVPALHEAEAISVPPGEASKGLEACQGIWGHLLAREADRQAVLVCLGGGVVTDLGGFAAGAYKRGIRCVHVPTSLMGMVDAAIGGKTAIDLAGVKNAVGLFHHPVAVHVHLPFLRSLGKRELLNGVAEMIKHGLVRDAAHYEAIREAPLHDLGALDPLVQASAAIKAAVVREDPREAGPRKLLNFGHTIGHALEACSWEGGRRTLLHGEAVAAGMVCAAWLSWRHGRLPRPALDRICEHLLSLYRPFPVEADEEHRIIELMRHDKKNSAGAFRFTLLDAIGEARTDAPVTAAQVREALAHYRLLARG